MDQNVATAIETLGFPIFCVIVVGFVFYKILIRVLDENKDRENANREHALKLVDANTKLSESLKDVADTIKESNDINEKSAETIRVLVDKVDHELLNIKGDLDMLNHKLEDNSKQSSNSA